MQAAEGCGVVSVEDYLAGELRSETRPEYLKEILAQPEQALELPSLNFMVPLDMIYEGIKV